MNDSANVQYKCGSCKWFINTRCETLQAHQCFTTFDEAVHEFVVDENLYIYMGMKSQDSSTSETGEQESVTAQGILNSEDTLGKLKWTHEAQLCLIHLYKKYLNDFNTTTERNDKVWGRLSQELIQNGFNYTPTQCKFKFKYLKSKYMQKKDNMKNTSTGAARIKFQYFPEMDDIFSAKPNVNPVSLASNLVHREINTDEDEILETNRETANVTQDTKKKNKKSPVEQLLNEMRTNASAREDARNRRHQENMQFKYQLLESLSKQMDTLINVLKK